MDASSRVARIYGHEEFPANIWPNRSQISDFTFLNQLGKGSFGAAFKVRRKQDQKLYCLKQINMSAVSERAQKAAITEVKALSFLDHPCIIKYYDAFFSGEKLNIVMELADNGTLYAFLKKQSFISRRLPEETIWRIFIQITMGLYHIHKRGILHRDLKSLNILIDKDHNMKIGDLGCAKILSASDGGIITSRVGTPYYLSPEICERRPYNDRADIWALGVILYECCTYRHPFDKKDFVSLVPQIIRGKYTPISTMYSKELANTIRVLLTRDAEMRPNIDSVIFSYTVMDKAKQADIQLPTKQATKPMTPTTQQATVVNSTTDMKENSTLIQNQGRATHEPIIRRHPESTKSRDISSKPQDPVLKRPQSETPPSDKSSSPGGTKDDTSISTSRKEKPDVHIDDPEKQRQMEPHNSKMWSHSRSTSNPNANDEMKSAQHQFSVEANRPTGLTTKADDSRNYKLGLAPHNESELSAVRTDHHNRVSENPPFDSSQPARENQGQNPTSAIAIPDDFSVASQQLVQKSAIRQDHQISKSESDSKKVVRLNLQGLNGRDHVGQSESARPSEQTHSSWQRPSSANAVTSIVTSRTLSSVTAATQNARANQGRPETRVAFRDENQSVSRSQSTFQRVKAESGDKPQSAPLTIQNDIDLTEEMMNFLDKNEDDSDVMMRGQLLNGAWEEQSTRPDSQAVIHTDAVPGTRDITKSPAGAVSPQPPKSSRPTSATSVSSAHREIPGIRYAPVFAQKHEVAPEQSRQPTLVVHTNGVAGFFKHQHHSPPSVAARSNPGQFGFLVCGTAYKPSPPSQEKSRPIRPGSGGPDVRSRASMAADQQKSSRPSSAPSVRTSGQKDYRSFLIQASQAKGIEFIWEKSASSRLGFIYVHSSEHPFQLF
eukprot:TRINITY_DN3450_c0_g1_i11.p1 TRINITY_DN3450_c0_g1~~TRINITY_DN3450_c0_g1_i11.p1  ORF type:complete len:890 (-),score=148.07 TRINITY_DN3450_c0_g1_i11:702-3371(-)